jgi:hypothetical protein
MAVQMEVHEKVARRKTTVRARRAVAVATPEDVEEREEAAPAAVAVASPRTMPRIVSVYRGPVGGELRHSRCERELIFIGMRGGIELDFYCLGCREHITLPEAALARVPVGRH